MTNEMFLYMILHVSVHAGKERRSGEHDKNTLLFCNLITFHHNAFHSIQTSPQLNVATHQLLWDLLPLQFWLYLQVHPELQYNYCTRLQRA